MSLRRRLEKIEKREDVLSLHTPCHHCGHVNGGPGPNTQWRVAFAEEELTGPERCPVCGAKLVFTITFDEEG